MRALLQAQAALLLLWRVAAQDALITPAATAAKAQNVSAILDPSYAGFGIEASNLFAFTGSSTQNDLTINLLQNLADYAGAPGQIRVGGNTADYFVYNASYGDYGVEANPASTGQGAIAWDQTIFGPKFFVAIDRLPKDTPIIFNLNLAYNAADWATKIVTAANATLDSLKNVKVISFEVGNEPDLYHQNGFRAASYSASQYIEEWMLRLNVLWAQTLQPRGLPSKFFEAACTVTGFGTGFEIASLVQDGIMKNGTDGEQFLAGWNKHDYYYFIDISGYNLTQDLFAQFSATESQFFFWAVEAAEAKTTGLPYYMREMGDVGPVGMKGISDIFTASLWTLNFLCYASTVNVSSVQMHMTTNSYASPWQPVPFEGQPAYVRPSYYAYVAFNQIMGSGNGSTQIAPFPISMANSLYQNYVRGYSFYSQGNITGIVLLNSKLTSSGINVTISLPDFAKQKLYLHRLVAPDSTSTANVTWNGFSFEENGDGTPSNVSYQIETVDLDSSGRVTLLLPDTSAIVATINFALPSIIELSTVVTKKNGSPQRGGEIRSAVGYAYALFAFFIIYQSI
jgi:hypothetical protein